MKSSSHCFVRKGIGQPPDVIPEHIVSPVASTSPWFISAHQKDAFAAIGITGCHREDYRVLDATKTKARLRPDGKWQEIESHSIADIPPEVIFTDAAVNRAFYKSSKLLALQKTRHYAAPKK